MVEGVKMVRSMLQGAIDYDPSMARGAVAVVLPGKQRDAGDTFLYTGEGGQDANKRQARRPAD